MLTCKHENTTPNLTADSLHPRFMVYAVWQVLMLIRQMEATSTQALAASVSLLCIGHQAILDAYLCLLHLTTGMAATPHYPHFRLPQLLQRVQSRLQA